MTLQIRDAGMQGLESGLQSQISAVLKGEEKSLKDALLGVVKSITDSMIDALSKSLTEKIMVKFIKFTQNFIRYVGYHWYTGSHSGYTARYTGGIPW